LAIAGVRLLIYRSGNAPAAGRGGIRDLARQGDDHRQPLWRVVIGASVRYLIVAEDDRDLEQLSRRLALTETLHADGRDTLSVTIGRNH